MRIGMPVLLLVMLAAGATPAAAQADHRRDRVDSGEFRSLDRLLPEIRRAHPGKFYDAEGPFTGPNGDYRYRLKWMTPEGRIIWLDADARTGRVLGVEGGRQRATERPSPRDYFESRYGARHSMDGGPPDARNEETPRRGYDRGRNWDRGRGNRNNGSRDWQDQRGYGRGD